MPPLPLLATLMKIVRGNNVTSRLLAAQRVANAASAAAAVGVAPGGGQPHPKSPGCCNKGRHISQRSGRPGHAPAECVRSIVHAHGFSNKAKSAKAGAGGGVGSGSCGGGSVGGSRGAPLARRMYVCAHPQKCFDGHRFYILLGEPIVEGSR